MQVIVNNDCELKTQKCLKEACIDAEGVCWKKYRPSCVRVDQRLPRSPLPNGTVPDKFQETLKRIKRRFDDLLSQHDLPRIFPMVKFKTL